MVMIEQKLVNKPKLANKPLLSIPDRSRGLYGGATSVYANAYAAQFR
jgi:hypothetical protein